MNMLKKCSQCGDNFHTATHSDSLCSHCDGSMPRLNYWEIDKDKDAK